MHVEIRSSGFYRNNHYFYPVGVNYWPQHSAVYMWPRYDPVKIETEFRIMKDIGINCIRMFIRWEDMMPTFGQLDATFFPKFAHFHSAAEKIDLTLCPTLFIGHMSGQDWFPPWFQISNSTPNKSNNVQEIGMPPRKRKKGWIRDIYSDEEIYTAAFQQLEALLPPYSNSNVILAWDLSNENQYWMHPKTPQDGQTYMRRLYEKMKLLDPNHPITLGMGKLHEKTGFHSYGPWGINRYLDFYSVHTYPVFFYPPTIRFLDYYITYNPGFEVRHSRITGKPIQEQEFGLSDLALMGRSRSTKTIQLGGYYTVVLWSALLNGARAGILAWDFTDFDTSLRHQEPYNHKPHELRFGVVDQDYQLKSSGFALQRFARIINQLDLDQYEEPPSEVAILVPENYNEYIDWKQIIATQSNTIPMKMQREYQHTIDYLKNQNKALFSAYIWCRNNGILPDFLDPNGHWTPYKVVIAPNLTQLSESTIIKMNSFLNRGGLLYISSDCFWPSKLAIEGQETMEIKPSALSRIQKTQIHYAPGSYVPERLRESFTELPNITINESLRRLEGISPEYLITHPDIITGPTIAGMGATDGEGAVILVTTAVELHHSSVKNAYKQENFQHVYDRIFNAGGVTRLIKCSNPAVEVGILIERRTDDWFLIAINHVQEHQRAEIEVSDLRSRVTDLEGKIVDASENRITIYLEAYGVRILRLRK